MVEGGECSMQAVLSEKRDLRGVNDEDARDCSRFEGLDWWLVVRIVTPARRHNDGDLVE